MNEQSNRRLDGQAVAGLLSAYGKAEKIADAIDRHVMRLALDMRADCQSLSGKICALTDKKLKYINLKVIIERALKKLPLKYGVTLKLIYCMEYGRGEAAFATGLTARTIGNLASEGLVMLSDALFDYGFDYEWYAREYKGDPYAGRCGITADEGLLSAAKSIENSL